MDRVVKADEEASRAHADASKAHKALRQLEVDVDALRLVSYDMLFQPCIILSLIPMYL